MPPTIMELRYEIFPDKSLIVARHRGVFKLREYIDHILTFWNDPRYSRSFDGVIDISELAVNSSIRDIKSVIELLSNNDKTTTGRWACITNTPLTTAYSMIYQQAVAKRHPFSIFTTWKAAGSFLGIPLPQELQLLEPGKNS